MKKLYFAFALSIMCTASLAQSSPAFNATKEEAMKAAGLEMYDTEENNKTTNAAAKNIDEIKNKLGAAFAGSWIEYDNNKVAHNVVAVKRSSNNDSSISNLPKGTKVVQVKYSYSDLEEFRSKIAQIFKDLAQGGDMLIFGIAISEQENKLSVRGLPENLNFINKKIISQGIPSDVFILEPQEGGVAFMGNIYGGTKTISTFDYSEIKGLCTAAFNVIIDNIYPGVITAAHCKEMYPAFNKVYFNAGGSPNNSIKGEYIGYYFANEWNNNIDAIMFANEKFVHNTYAKIITTPYNLPSVKPLGAIQENTPVCTSGGTTGWRCGTQAKASSVQYVNGKQFQFSEATFCGGGGDSGGPVVSGQNNALGIYIGVLGANGPASTCGAIFGGGSRPNSIYQPLAPYLAKYPNTYIRSE